MTVSIHNKKSLMEKRKKLMNNGTPAEAALSKAKDYFNLL